MQLDKKIYSKITLLCERGNMFFEKGELDKALLCYQEALNILPIPKINWDAGLWLYTALGDVYFLKADFENAKENLFNALNCPDGNINPFVLCRLGQTLYELKDFERAKEYLLKAFMLEGFSIFKGENIKYINFIKSFI